MPAKPHVVYTLGQASDWTVLGLPNQHVQPGTKPKHISIVVELLVPLIGVGDDWIPDIPLRPVSPIPSRYDAWAHLIKGYLDIPRRLALVDSIDVNHVDHCFAVLDVALRGLDRSVGFPRANSPLVRTHSPHTLGR